MIDHRKEQISSFMDSELTDDFSVALDHLVRNENMRKTWSRYHLVSDILQQKLPIHFDNQLSSRISESIKKEPTILAPALNTVSTLLKPVLGITIAASVAAIAILGIQQYRSSEISRANTTQVAGVQETVPSFRNSIPVQPIVVSKNPLKPTPINIQSNTQLNRYLMNHNEYRTNTGVQGVTPYARLVATESQ